MDEILKCDHSNESNWAVLSCGAVCFSVQGGSNCEVVDEILRFDNSNESYWAVLSYKVFMQYTVEITIKVYKVLQLNAEQ